MTKDILYTTANDSEGKLTKIADAVKGGDYFCPECNGQMVVKRSGRTGKGTRRPHFSHESLSSNCTPEGVLHHSFKKFTMELLKKYLGEGRALMLHTVCKSCGSSFAGDLLASVGSIEEEYDLRVCRPDIALLDKNGYTYAVIEIVVTHAPEIQTLYLYREGDVCVIQINVESDMDLDHVQDRLTSPNFVDFCWNPECRNYSASTVSRTIRVTPDRCGRCFAQTEKYDVVLETPFGTVSTKRFLNREVEYIKSVRPFVAIIGNSSSAEQYPQFVCMNCKRIGSFYRPRRRF